MTALPELVRRISAPPVGHGVSRETPAFLAIAAALALVIGWWDVLLLWAVGLLR